MADAATPRTPHFIGHRDRLRQRFSEAGGEALPDYELLELVLFRSIPRRDVKALAKALIARFGSFAEVVSAPIERLTEVDGVGEMVATDLKIVVAAGDEAADPLLLDIGDRLLPQHHGLCGAGTLAGAVPR
jgi:DNA repair protein RadC